MSDIYSLIFGNCFILIRNIEHPKTFIRAVFTVFFSLITGELTGNLARDKAT